MASAILRVHPVALLAASGGGEDHAEAEGDQPVAFDDAEKLLVAEQVRFMQPFLETLVQPGPLRQRQAYLQRAPAKRLGDVHQLFGEFPQLLRHALPPVRCGRRGSHFSSGGAGSG